MAYNQTTDYMAIINNPNSTPQQRADATASRKEKMMATDYQAIINNPNATAQEKLDAQGLRKEKLDMIATQPTTPATTTPKIIAPAGTPSAPATPDTPRTTAPDGTPIVTGGGVQPLTPTLTGQGLGDKYGLTYDMGKIKEILDNATKGIYDNKNEAFKTTENNFYNQMGGLQAASLDTLKKTQAAAVATGASKGMAAANELSAILGLQEQTAPIANDLGNQRNLLASEEAAAYSKNSSTALDTSNSIKQAIANLDLTKYGYDTQESIGIMDYLAALQDIEATKDASAKTLDGVKYNADSNLAGTKYNSDGYNKNSSSYTGSGGGGTSVTGGGTNTGAGSTTGTIGANLNDQLSKSNNAWTPPGKNFTISDNKNGTCSVAFSDGTAVYSYAEMQKFENNNWNKEAMSGNGGSFTYDKTYDVGNVNKNMTREQVISYYKKTGKCPTGWMIGWAKTGIDAIATPKYIGSEQTNKSTFDGSQGSQYSIGQGNTAQTWTYNYQTGLWNSNFGTAKNQAEFGAYLQKQNAMYVRKIK